MKRLVAICGMSLALLCATTAPVRAQSLPPPLPALTPQQSASVAQRVDAYRSETDARVARGEITADEAERLVKWREWQFAQQTAGLVPAPSMRVASDVPPDYYEQRPDYVEPAPYYVYRYPAPYYWAPRPYYWGPVVCAGGFGRHFGGSFCF
jgi:hypothetical protein